MFARPHAVDTQGPGATRDWWSGTGGRELVVGKQDWRSAAAAHVPRPCDSFAACVDRHHRLQHVQYVRFCLPENAHDQAVRNAWHGKLTLLGTRYMHPSTPPAQARLRCSCLGWLQVCLGSKLGAAVACYGRFRCCLHGFGETHDRRCRRLQADQHQWTGSITHMRSCGELRRVYWRRTRAKKKA